MCDNYILISVRIWAGGGYTSPKGTMPTSALVPVLTYAVQTPPTARWEKVPLLESVLVFGNVLANPHLFCHLPFTAAEPVQHLEPRSVRLSLLCSSGLGAPNHPLLRGSLPESRAAFKHGRQVLQVQLNFKVFEGGKGGRGEGGCPVRSKAWDLITPSTARSGYEELKQAMYSLASMSTSFPCFSFAQALKKQTKKEMESTTAIDLEDLSYTTSPTALSNPSDLLVVNYFLTSVFLIFFCFSSILYLMSTTIGIQRPFSVKEEQNNKWPIHSQGCIIKRERERQRRTQNAD